MRKTGKRLCAALMVAVLGAGCGVPGVMATRTIENEKDRR